MSESKQWQFHTPELKAKVDLEAIRGIKTLNKIALEFGIHPVQVGQCKKEFQDHAKRLFEGKGSPKPVGWPWASIRHIFVERLWRSVKHEDVYLKGYATMGEIMIGLIEYFVLYNIQCPPPCQNSCRLVMIFNFGAIRNKYGTLRRDIEEQSSCKVVTA
jgi:hypothetical protein